MKKCLSVLLLVIILAGCRHSNIPAGYENTPAPKPKKETEYTISPLSNEDSDPKNWSVKWEIFENNQPVDSFRREKDIYFEHANYYYLNEGVTTFRGNNYRNSPTYGTVDIKDNSLDIIWQHSIGTLGDWSGCGWSGQPLIVRWARETREIMNIFPEKKQKENLAEVIYATMDGNIYFYDLEDGKPTRDKLNVGMTFKGTGTLDPRGYPIMYIGSGIATDEKSQRMYAIDLIENKVIYEQSGLDPQALRGWAAFDSSPIIDGETDTLIWPGENGILYTIKLNTVYDRENGKITINPENVAKCRYRTALTDKGRWHGFESSCVAVGNHLYVTENSGMMFCIDLNTMELVWAKNILDDSNSTPVFEWTEDGEGAIYTAPALRWTAEDSIGSTTIFKIDAKCGDILWSNTYPCVRNGDNSGGVQSSPAIGKKGSDIENLIFFNIASTPTPYKGLLIAFDKETGNVVWEHTMNSYTWSSPAPVYTNQGKGYIIICDSAGNVKLIDGKSGTYLTSVNIGSNVEASPAVFEDTLVVGTRGCRICAIKIK